MNDSKYETRSTDENGSLQSEESERCSIIILPTTPRIFHVPEISHSISETITKEHTILQQPIQRGNILVSQTRGPQAGILIMQLLKTVVEVTFQNLAIAASSLKEDHSMAIPCECTSAFTIIEDILRSANIQFITFRLCRGKASLTYGTTTKAIPTDEIRRLEAVVKKIGSYKDATSNLLSRTTGDIMKTRGAEAAASHVVVLSDQEFLSELNELRYQHQQIVKALNAMKEKLCGNPSHRVLQNGVPKNQSSQPSLLYRLQTYGTKDTNTTTLLESNTSHDNTTEKNQDSEYAHSAATFQGVNSEGANFQGVHSKDAYSKSVHDSVGVHSKDAYPTNHESTKTESDSRGIKQDIDPDSGTLMSPDSAHVTSERANSESGNPEGGNSESVNSEGVISENVTSESVNSEGAHSGDAMATGAQLWRIPPDVFSSCDHYDRYCDVQFSCCDDYWPCHRCHNTNSSCSTRLRSQDIKKLKCKRCGRIQEFPQISPHCVECNIKFSDYFCAICQHLTGTVNHPFHCDKCGICRVHANRSFHCDVCGVCLDVQLRGNHRCRAGSANDKCRICLEDACQILPCSHKATVMLPNRITIEQETSSSGIQETHQNLEDQSESEERFSNNQHAPRPQATEYQVSIFENYIPATIDTNFEFIREDVPAITDSLSGKG